VGRQGRMPDGRWGCWDRREIRRRLCPRCPFGRSVGLSPMGVFGGCWDRRETGVDSAPHGARRSVGMDFFSCCCLGMAGRPGSERLMRLPCRECPLGMGLRPGSCVGENPLLEPGM
jgi:hypothetical protein